MTNNSQTIAPNIRLRGRGATSNQVSRFEPYQRLVMDDGWDIPEDEMTARTEVAIEVPRTVISRNTSPDLPFDRSLNPYRGCEHGCIYCYARPSHAYLGMSPGLDFETRLIARPSAPERLHEELSKSGYTPAVMALGSNTDPYQPIEKRYEIMRGVLRILQDFQHPVAVVTKGTLIERDIDILGEMGRAGLATVGISITTLDPRLARGLEPRAPSPSRRLAVIQRLAQAGCPVRLMVAPIIPALTDHELEKILQAGADAGAVSASWTMLRLPREVSPLFQDWLANHHPNRADRVMARVREMHGGQDYSPQWGARMRGQGRYAEMIRDRFKLAVKRVGLGRYRARLRCDLFQVPGRAVQLSLF